MQIIWMEDSHPPLYYMLLKAWSSIFGYSIAWAKIMSIAGVLCLAGLSLGPVKRLVGEKTALIFMALALFMPFSFYIALDIRMYAFAAFFVTGAFAYASLIGTGKSVRGDWLKLTFFALAAMYTHHYAMINVFFIYAGLFFIMLQKRMPLKAYIISGSVLVLCYLPELYFLVHHTINSQKTLVLDMAFWQNSFRLFLIPVPFAYMNLIFVVCAMMTCGWVAWLTFLLNRQETTTTAYKIALSALALVFLMVLSASVATFLFRPIVAWRYYLPLMGVLILGWAIALDKEKRIAIIFAVLFVVSFGICYANKNDMAFDKTQDKINAFLREVVQPNEWVVANSLESYFHTLYFFPDYPVRLTQEAAEKQLLYLKEDIHIATTQELQQLPSFISFEGGSCAGHNFYDLYNGQEYCLRRMNFLLEKK